MNQILSTKPQSKNKKSREQSTKKIVKIFAIFLIIFGLGLTSTGSYGFYRNIKEAKELLNVPVSKPIITIERVSAAIINIVVTHDSGISKVTYTINNETPIQINGQEKLEVTREVELSNGTSSILVTAEDIYGVTETYERTIDVQQSATITISQEEGKLKAIIDSQTGLDYIEYYWDNQEQNATHEAVSDNSLKVEKLIDVLEGEHTLTVKAVDIEGKETKKSQKAIGDYKPELNITTDGQKFYITASDDQGLTKVEITLNDNETITKEITGKEYTEAIDNLVIGDNKLKVVVYNINGLYIAKGVIFTKE